MRPNARPPRTCASPTSRSGCKRRAAEADAHRERLAAAQSELSRLTAFWHYFRRRRQPARARSASPGRGGRRLGGGRSARGEERDPGRGAPEFPGISLGARRNINLAIISYAESLCEHVDEFGLAARAKEAVARRVHEMAFGSRAECEDYMQRVQKAQAAIANHRQITAAVKGKLERLRATRRVSQSRRHGAHGGFARGRERRGAQSVERARRGLLGPVQPAAALKRRPAPRAGERPSMQLVVRSGAPRLGRAYFVHRGSPRNPRRSASPRRG